MRRFKAVLTTKSILLVLLVLLFLAELANCMIILPITPSGREKTDESSSSNSGSGNYSREFNGIKYQICTYSARSKASDNRQDFTLGDENSDKKEADKYCMLEFAEAVRACDHQLNMTLLTIRSAAENEFVKEWIFDTLKIEQKIWLSLTRVNQTMTSSSSRSEEDWEFRWSDGRILTPNNSGVEYQNWHKCEPNDITRIQWNLTDWGEDCTEMYSHYYPYPNRCGKVKAEAGQWNDIPCTEISNLVVCQSKHEVEWRTIDIDDD